MAEKRDRRVAPGSNRQNVRVEPSAQNEELGDSASSDRRLVIIFVVFFIISPAISAFIYKIKFAIRTTRTDDSYVYQRGLIIPDMNYNEILSENTKVSENMSRRHYTFPVLAYITPWNSKGYEMAKRFNSKFIRLSPVWYDLKSQGSNLIHDGRHNADIGWISELRKAGDARLSGMFCNRFGMFYAPLLVLPRVVLEAFLKKLLTKKKLRNRAMDLIVFILVLSSVLFSLGHGKQEIHLLLEMGYDGIVLESWLRWAAYDVLHDPTMWTSALQFIIQLGHALHSVSSERNDKLPLALAYVIGPPHSEKLQAHDFAPEDLQSLGEDVDGFSLMTYDVSGLHNPGPNAPLKWISSTLELVRGSTRNGVWSLAHKIFLGINFYGNDFILSECGGGGAITGSDHLALLEKHKPLLQWKKK